MNNPIAYLEWLFYDILILSSIIPVFRRGFKWVISRNVLFLYILIFITIGVFGYITADWGSYLESVTSIYSNNGNWATNFEEIWRLLSIHVHGNIYFFRFILFTITYIVFAMFIQNFVNLNNRYLFLFLFLLLSLYAFSGARQSLPIILFYFAFALMGKNRISFLLSILLIIGCFYLHKATLLFYPILFLSFFRPSKKVIMLIIIYGLLLLVWVRLYFIDFALKYLAPIVGEWTLNYYLAGQEIFGNNAPIGSRRTILANTILNPVMIVFYGLTLYYSFKSKLSNLGIRFRSFLFYGLLMYLVLKITGIMNSSDRLLSMIMLPSIYLLSEMHSGKFWKSKYLTYYTIAFSMLFFIYNNILISGFIGFGAGLFG